MKKSKIIIFLFYLSIGCVHAQIKPEVIAKLKDSLTFVKSDTSIVNIYIQLELGYRYSEIDSGLHYADKAIKLSEKINYPQGKINALTAKGFIFLEAGDIPRSLNCQLTALKILEDHPNNFISASILNRIGNIYMELNEYKTSINYYRKSEEFFSTLNDSGYYFNEISNIGNIYEKMGELDSARYYQYKVLNYSMNHDERALVVLGEMRARLGNLEAQMGNYNAAFSHYRIGIKESLTDFDSRNLAFNYIQMAKLFYQLNLYDSCFIYSKKTIETGKNISYKKVIYEASSLLSKLFKLKHQPDSALFYNELSNAYKDSLYGPETFQKLQLITLSEEKRQHELEKENEELQNRYRQITSLSALFVFILIALILWFNYKKQKVTNKILTIQKNQIEEHSNQISAEKKKSDDLLLNILPAETAEELKQKGSADAKQFDEVTVMFTDFKNFTQISEKLSPSELVAEIHYCYKEFDNIITKFNIEKIKTIGDAYMCAGGLPVINKTNAIDVINAAFEIQQFINQRYQERIKENKEPFEIRIGIHTGPVVAGIVGIKKFAYDIWGDTVNIASRMESSGEVGKINISGNTYELVKDKARTNEFNFIYRGKIQAKNKGEIDMYFVERV